MSFVSQFNIQDVLPLTQVSVAHVFGLLPIYTDKECSTPQTALAHYGAFVSLG